jgi:hypothetical protein
MTRLAFAGSEAHFNVLYGMGVRDMLFSYYHMDDKNIQSLAKRYKLDERDKVRIIIDSGGFTFNMDPDKHTNKELYAYRDRYIQWLYDNKEYITAAVELDVSIMIGDEKLQKWRKKYFKPLEKAGIPIIYVWHEEDGLDGWKQLCKENKYVGLTSLAGWEPSQIKRYLREAQKYKSKVHGFAFTSTEHLPKLDFTTVDSTTWISGMKYGCTYVFDNKRLITYDANTKHMRNKYRAHFVKRGINWDLVKLDFKKDDQNRRLAQPEITKINILGWLEFGQFLHKKSVLRKKLRKTRQGPELAVPEKQEQKLEEKQVLIPVEKQPIISLIERKDVPKLKCSSCHISEDCDKFDENRTECAYTILDVDVDNPDDLISLRKHIIKTDYERLQRQYQFEQQSGGYVDKITQSLADSLFERMSRLAAEIRAIERAKDENDMPSNEEAANAGSVMQRILAPLVESAKALQVLENHHIEGKFTEVPFTEIKEQHASDKPKSIGDTRFLHEVQSEKSDGKP